MLPVGAKLPLYPRRWAASPVFEDRCGARSSLIDHFLNIPSNQRERKNTHMDFKLFKKECHQCSSEKNTPNG
jgi:hypothetical protein